MTTGRQTTETRLTAMPRRQFGYDLGRLTWQRLDATGPPGAILREAVATLAADAR